MLLPAIAVAEPSSDEKTPSAAATIVVDLISEPGTEPWVASAFEQSITRELSGFERLTPVSKEDFSTRDCGADFDCRLRIYRAAHVDIVLFGRTSDDTIEFELYQTWTPARLDTGSISIDRDQGPIALKQQTRHALHTVLKHGGLLDQKAYIYRGEADTTGFAISFSLILLVLVGLALPFAVLWRRPWRIPTLRTARRSAAVAIALVAYVLATTATELAPISQLVGDWPWIFAGLGGLAWGTFVVATMRAALAPLDGLARIAHTDVGRIIRTWCVVAVQRLFWVVMLYAPFLVFAVWFGEQLAVPDPWTFLLVAPVVLVVARLWVASWVECLALRLDYKLVDGDPSADNPWSREVSDYVMGYVRRTGWDLDPHLLARVVFLPGKHGEGVITYGGGATHARIVIDRSLLEFAMGELEEAKPGDEKPVLWPDWTTGVVAVRASSRRTLAHAFHKPRPVSYAKRKPLGQPATLLGYVVPAPGELVPLISDNPQDLAVVRELLSEHYPWNAPDPDEEFDATDPTDKDMLFGALVRELGVVQRQDCQVQTLKLSLGKRLKHLSSTHVQRLADAYPALNFARDHFIQYLYYRWTKNTDLLTARARAHKLLDTSQRILADARAGGDSKNPKALHRRLVWLSHFYTEPILDSRERRLRRFVFAVTLGGALVAFAMSINRSLSYHPAYIERMAEQERQHAISKQKALERKQKETTHGEGNTPSQEK